MYKLTILFRQPRDPAQFDKDWTEKFVPAADEMPGVLRIEVSHIDGGPTGPAEYHKMHEFYFADRTAMDNAMHSQKGVLAGNALQAIAPGLYTLLFADVSEDIVRPAGFPPEARRSPQ